MPSLRPSWQIWKGLYAVLLDKEEPRRWILRKSNPESCINPGPIGPETPDSPSPVPNPKPYMLWCCIDMRCTAFIATSLAAV
jgi:hypothetical protein